MFEIYLLCDISIRKEPRSINYFIEEDEVERPCAQVDPVSISHSAPIIVNPFGH